MGVRITLNKSLVTKRVKKAESKLVTVISNELLKDANYYARHDTGEMIDSSITASEPEKGRLVWDTPYAKEAYYTGTPSKDKNPNASLLWAKVANDKNKDKYLRMAKKIVDTEV